MRVAITTWKQNLALEICVDRQDVCAYAALPSARTDLNRASATL